MRTDTEILNWLIEYGGFGDDPNDEVNIYAKEKDISLKLAIREIVTDILDNPEDDSEEEVNSQMDLF